MCGKPQEKSGVAGRQSLSSTISISNDMSNKTTFFPSLYRTFHRCPPYDSSSYQPPAFYSQWRSRYRPAIIWTGDRGGDGVSIELPLAALRTNPPNGEANGWLTTSIDSPPACLPAFLPLTSSLLYPCYLFSSLSFSLCPFSFIHLLSLLHPLFFHISAHSRNVQMDVFSLTFPCRGRA